MSSLTTNDIRTLETLFQMQSGYVLNFTDKDINDFFKRDLSIIFYGEKYSQYGTSKGKTLKCLFDIESDDIVVKVILKLIEYLKNEILIGNLGKHDYPDEIIIKGRKIADKLKVKNNSISEFVFTEEHITNEWEKAKRRLQGKDIEGSITIARTLIESVLKYILDDSNEDYDINIKLPKLYKEVQKLLNLAPEQHQEQIFKEILGGTSKVINGLGNLRNQLGDSHGGAMGIARPKYRHGELAVNLAGSMAIFLYKTYKNK